MLTNRRIKTFMLISRCVIVIEIKQKCHFETSLPAGRQGTREKSFARAYDVHKVGAKDFLATLKSVVLLSPTFLLRGY